MAKPEAALAPVLFIVEAAEYEPAAMCVKLLVTTEVSICICDNYATDATDNDEQMAVDMN